MWHLCSWGVLNWFLRRNSTAYKFNCIRFLNHIFHPLQATVLKVANFSSKLQRESVFIISVLNANFVWIPLLWFFPMIETLECNKKIVRLQKAHAHDVYFNMFSLKASKQASVILYKKWSCSRRAEVCQPWQPGQSQPSFGTLSARSNPTQERWYHRISQSKLTQAIISSSLSSLSKSKSKYR